jgi:phenylacetate-coenzyme A ligase PaaK-like adenylate-forming protein
VSAHDGFGTKLAQRVFVPFYEKRWGLYGPEIGRDLAKSQYWPSSRLAEEQWASVRSLLSFAYERNSFYRARMDALGIVPADLRDWSDFERLPLLTKEDLREDSNAVISAGYQAAQMFYKRTGGSTGVPVRLYWDEHAHRFKRAVVKRHDAWAGYVLGRKQAALWGDTEKSYPWRERLYKALCERTIYLDTLLMDEAYMAAFVERLRKFRPRCLIGHAHSLFFFTEYVVSCGAEDIAFDSIISTAETLSGEERALIEGRFGPVVFDRYGCEELSLVASECEAHDGLHLSAEGLYVELVDADGRVRHWWDDEPSAVTSSESGDASRIVVTDLSNRGMPFVRYEVGDLARWAPGECSCGRGLPRLEKVLGRVTDLLYAPDGRKISGVSILDTFIIHVLGIRQAQIVQDEIDHLELRIVADVEFGAASRRQLTHTVADVFGPAMRHDVVLVDRIEPTPRGKYQFTICQIEAPK